MNTAFAITQGSPNDTSNDIYESFISQLNVIDFEFQEATATFQRRYEALMLESEIYQDDSEVIAYLEAEEQKEDNVFAKIGDKLIALAKATVEAINRMVQAVRDKFFAHKSDDAKVKALVKAHPDMADKIWAEVKAGNLEVRDIKSFTELNNEYNKIMELAKKGTIDPNSLKGRWETAKRKFFGEKRTIAGDIKAVATTAGAIMTLFTLKSKIQEEMAAVNSKTARSFNHLTAMATRNNAKGKLAEGGQAFSHARNNAQYNTMMFYISKDMANCAASTCKEYQTVFDRIDLAFRKALDSVSNAIPGGTDRANRKIDRIATNGIQLRRNNKDSKNKKQPKDND